MAQAPRDQNRIPTLLAASNADGTTPITVYADPTTHRLLVDTSGGGGISSLNGQTGSTQTFADVDDTNVTLTITSAADVHTFTMGWQSTLAVARGGIGTGTAGIGAFNNITGFTASGATGTTSTNLVFSTSPVLTTPNIGAATATSVNGLTITSSSGTLTIANGSTLATSGANSITLTSVGATNVTLPTTGTLMANPMTTGGDIIYGGASGVPTRLANGSAGQVLTSNGTTLAPSWTTNGAGTVTDVSVVTANGVSGSVATSTTTPAITLTLGAITPTTVNGLTITSTSGGTLTLANSSSLVTSGGNSITLTSTGATNVTFPTTGTLATLAGSEELTNKTLNASVGKGTWTASGTWTLPALTTGGLVTMGANIQMGENTEILLDAALSADGKYCGITESGTAGATLAFGDSVYFSVTDSRWELTDADADATAGAVKIGVCVLAAAADGDPTKILLFGKIRADSVFPTFTVGAPVYLSTTAGDYQTAQPSGTDDVIRIVGYGNTGDELDFRPSNDYITHT